jgi:hypothetical protein
MKDATDVGQKPDCVVVDTSIWRSDPLLRGPMGVTLVYVLSRQEGRLALPEVVESELKKQIVEVGREARAKVDEGARILSLLTDRVYASDSPDDEFLEACVDSRLKELEPLLLREAFTLEHAKAALAMVNARIPPNGPKDQQFKDSAIWQAALSVAARHSTHLVTKDKAFFAERDTAKGLAANLLIDCRRAGVTINLHSDIASCLKALTADEPPVDRERVAELIQAAVLNLLRVQAEKQRFEVTGPVETKIKAFRTVTPDRIAIDYTLITGIVDGPSLGCSPREDARGIAHGSCYYLPALQTLEGHLVQQISLRHKSGSNTRTFREYDAAYPFPRPLDFERADF